MGTQTYCSGYAFVLMRLLFLRTTHSTPLPFSRVYRRARSPLFYKIRAGARDWTLEQRYSIGTNVRVFKRAL